MLKKIIMIVLFLFFASTMNIVQAEQDDEVKKTLKDFVQENKIPGVAVALYVDGKLQEYYLGHANETKKTPVTKNTIFEVGSITKLMTSLLLAQQIDAAKAQLDNSILDYLPTLSNKYEDITLGNLATHTSGLAFELPETIHTKKTLDKYLAESEPDYSTDTEWAYSNVGMGLLGMALEKMTHKKIDQLYREKIFKPLHITESGLNEPIQLKKWIAQGHDEKGKPVKLTELDPLAAGYGLKMSVSDMQKFLAAAIGLPGTPESLFYQIRMTQASYVKLSDRKQGLGWEIHSLKPDKAELLLDEPEKMNLGPVSVKQLYEKPKFNGDSLIDKTGSTDGFRAYIAVIPNKKAGIVILVNRAISNSEIVTTAREILFKLAKVKIDEE